MSNFTAKYDHATDADVPAIARLVSNAFGSTIEGATQWVRDQGPADNRVMRAADGSTPGCLRRIAMGQYFGGRPVKMAGIAGVVVSPEARGRGIALEMMRACLREAAADGFALSTLYASTQALYRQVGYEQAGGRWLLKIPLVHLDVRERSREIEVLPPEAIAAVQGVYGQFARGHDGTVARTKYIWDRVVKMREKCFEGYALREAGQITGYLWMRQERRPNGRMTIELSDIAATTPTAWRGLLGFLADFGSMADEGVFHGSPVHPALLLVSQQRRELSLHEAWLMRIVRLEEAVAQRGFTAGLDAEVHLDVEDDVIAENAGRWVVRVKDGSGRAERGGRGEIRVGARGLAAMYSGWVTPAGLAQVGLAQGEAAALARAAGVFAGSGAPWMPDFF